jgi:hypothetical protein
VHVRGAHQDRERDAMGVDQQDGASCPVCRDPLGSCPFLGPPGAGTAAARSAPRTHQATVPSPWHPPPWLLFCFLGCLRDGFVRRT